MLSGPDFVAGALVVAGTVLVALWLATNQRLVRGRSGRAGEWEGADRPELWTSAARCVRCRRGGGLLERDGETLWFTCLACGHRQRRTTKA
jgi:hypothetical protein